MCTQQSRVGDEQWYRGDGLDSTIDGSEPSASLDHRLPLSEQRCSKLREGRLFHCSLPIRRSGKILADHFTLFGIPRSICYSCFSNTSKRNLHRTYICKRLKSFQLELILHFAMRNNLINRNGLTINVQFTANEITQ